MLQAGRRHIVPDGTPGSRRIPHTGRGPARGDLRVQRTDHEDVLGAPVWRSTRGIRIHDSAPARACTSRKTRSEPSAVVRQGRGTDEGDDVAASDRTVLCEMDGGIATGSTRRDGGRGSYGRVALHRRAGSLAVSELPNLTTVSPGCERRPGHRDRASRLTR